MSLKSNRSLSKREESLSSVQTNIDLLLKEVRSNCLKGQSIDLSELTKAVELYKSVLEMPEEAECVICKIIFDAAKPHRTIEIQQPEYMRIILCEACDKDLKSNKLEKKPDKQ